MVSVFDRIRALNFPLGSYVIFGSGPLVVRGLKEFHDIDIFVSSALFEEYRQKSEWKLKKLNTDDYLENDSIELWHNWRPGEWQLESLVSSADVIDGLYFVNLKEVLRWKKLHAREKDLKDAKIIEDYLVKNLA